MAKAKDLAKDDVFERYGQSFVFGHACVMDKRDVVVCWDASNGRATAVPADVEVEKIGTLSRMIQNAKIKTPSTVDEFITGFCDLIEQFKLYQVEAANREAVPSVEEPAGGGEAVGEVVGACQHIYGKGTADYNNGGRG